MVAAMKPTMYLCFSLKTSIIPNLDLWKQEKVELKVFGEIL